MRWQSCARRVASISRTPQRQSNGSAKSDEQIDRGSAFLSPNDEEADTFSGPDRDGGRVVDEVLVATNTAAGVLGQRADDSILRADRAGERDVALHEWDTYRHAKTKGDRKDGQDPTEHDDEQEPAAAGAATDAAWSSAPSGLLAVGHEYGSLHRARGRLCYVHSKREFGRELA
jgi:hypothetical protein